MEGRGSAAGHLAVVAMVLVLVMAPGALAASHVVGGATQKWDLPASNDQTYYTSWAANQTFAVGDTLLFEYSSSQHDVVQYNTLAEYTACSGTAVSTHQTGNDSITLSAAGPYYFICSIPGHCTAGMKVSVTVGGAVTPASPPTTTPSPPSTTPPPPTVTSPPPPPPPNAASSGPVLSMAGLLIAALVASLAFLV